MLIKYGEYSLVFKYENRYKTGIEDLDDFLGGGIQQGSLIIVFGNCRFNLIAKIYQNIYPKLETRIIKPREFTYLEISDSPVFIGDFYGLSELVIEPKTVTENWRKLKRTIIIGSKKMINTKFFDYQIYCNAEECFVISNDKEEKLIGLSR